MALRNRAPQGEVLGLASLGAPASSALELDFTAGALATGVAGSRTSLGTMIDGSGQLTYAPNNLLTNSSNLAGSGWTRSGLSISSGIDDPFGGTGAFTYTASIAGAELYQQGGILTVDRAISSVWLRRRTGTGVVNLRNPNNGTGPTINLTSSWVRYASVMTAGNTFSVFVGTSGDQIDVFAPQFEAVTYQTAPRSYLATTTPAYGPRLNNAPGGSKGVIVEPAATNLLLQSQALDAASWTKTNVIVTPNATTAPDATLTAALVTTSNASNSLRQIANIVAGTPVLASVYVKKSADNFLRVQLTDNVANAFYIIINLATGASGSTGSVGSPTNTSFSIADSGGGWYRVSVGAVLSTATTAGLLLFSVIDSSGSGLSGGTYYAWGGQLEAGTVATSYIPTAATAVPRAADTVSFTSPASALKFTFDDGSTQTVTGVTPGSTYTIPTTLTGRVISKITEASLAFPLDLANGGVLPSGVVAQSGANGTRMNSSGVLVAANGGPRYDYNSAGVLQGLLIEPARTNLLTYSNDQSGWIHPALTVSQTATGPAGPSTAWAISEGSTSVQQAFYQQTSLASGIYTASMYLKQGGRRYVTVAIKGGGQGVRFDLQSGIIVDTLGSVAGTISDAGNGWFRVSVAITVAGGTDYLVVSSSDNLQTLATVSGSDSYLRQTIAGINGVAFYFYGAQQEAGSSATSYIPTTSTAVTRSADAISLTIPSNVSGLTFIFDDGSRQTIPNLTPGQVYTIPANLNRSRIKSLDWLSLDLQFTAMSALSDLTAKGITFSRTSHAMMYDATGKLTYAPNNLLVYSNTISNAAWGVGGSAVKTGANASYLDPDGNPLFELTLAGGTVSYMIQNLTFIPGASYILSVYIRTKTGTGTIKLQGFDGGATNVSPDLAVSTTLTRVSYKFTASATAGSGTFAIRNDAAQSALSVLVYGFQAELVTYQTSPGQYIPTTSAAVYGPRFDYDPVTLAAKGLLIEEARTNNILQSSNLAAASWTSNGAIQTANSITAPDGTLTGTLLTASANSSLQQLYQGTASGPNGVVTNSYYLKAGTASWVSIAIFDASVRYENWFNISTGARGTTAAGCTTSITPVGNGWYRCAVTRTIAAKGDYFAISICDADNSINTTSGKTIYAWGAQQEAGAFATSYIPTTSAAVTRAADNVSMTGANFSSWYAQAAGTFSANIMPLTTSAALFYMGVNYSDILIYNGGASYDFRWGSSGSVDLTGSLNANASNKLAAAYTNGDTHAISVNNAAPSTSGLTPSVTATGLSIGSVGWVSSLQYFTARRSNTDLQSLTSANANTNSGAGSSSGIGAAVAVGTNAGATYASGAGAAAGSGAASATSAFFISGAGSATCAATVTATGAATKFGAGSSTGLGIAAAASQTVISAPGSSTGLGVAVGTTGNFVSGAGAAAGSATPAAVGGSTRAASASSAGSGAASAVGQTLASGSGTGVSVATSTVAATGSSTAFAIGAASGAAAASATGFGLSAGAGLASGLAAVSGSSAAQTLVAGAGSSTGSGATASVGTSILRGAGTSAGSAAVSGVSGIAITYGSGIGAAVGLSVVSGVLFATATAQGSAPGSSQVSGLGIRFITIAGSGLATGIGSAHAETRPRKLPTFNFNVDNSNVNFRQRTPRRTSGRNGY